MTKDEAMEILIRHNAWRRGDIDGLSNSPKEIGHAIDVAIQVLSGQINLVPVCSDAWELVEGVIGRCTCDVAYVSRQMTDPNCRWCDYHVDLIELLTTYADQKVAEAKANWAEEKRHLINSIRRLQSEISEKYGTIKHLTAKCEALIAELDAVNESLTSALTPPVPDQTVRVPSEETKQALYVKMYPEMLDDNGRFDGYDSDFEEAWDACLFKIKSLNPNTEFETI